MTIQQVQSVTAYALLPWAIAQEAAAQHFGDCPFDALRLTAEVTGLVKDCRLDVHPRTVLVMPARTKRWPSPRSERERMLKLLGPLERVSYDFISDGYSFRVLGP
jgi:hypothetical protein